MHGGNAVERPRNDFLNNVRHSRSAIHMLDKEVQYDPPETMDYEGTDSGLGGSGELSTVTVVEINNSPTTTMFENSAFNNSSRFSNSTEISETSINGHEHNNSIIKRNSIEKLREEMEEGNESLCLPDTPDCATLPASFKSALDTTRLDPDSVDEIREQSSLVVLNNSVNNEDKLKELSEKPDESNCALDCLSFTIQCCDCTIL